VISSGMIPLTGTVGDVRLSGVVHVVTQLTVLHSGHPLDGPTQLTAYAYLTPDDVTAVDQQGNDYLAHGAGTAVIPVPDGEGITVGAAVVTGFFRLHRIKW
jgi:hypothetical protein